MGWKKSCKSRLLGISIVSNHLRGISTPACLFQSPSPMRYAVDGEAFGCLELCVFISVVSRNNIWVFSTTRAAPRCPKIDQYHLAAKGRELVAFAFWIFEFKVGCLLANVSANARSVLYRGFCASWSTFSESKSGGGNQSQEKNVFFHVIVYLLLKIVEVNDIVCRVSYINYCSIKNAGTQQLFRRSVFGTAYEVRRMSAPIAFNR
jgi:hypothetical protein